MKFVFFGLILSAGVFLVGCGEHRAGFIRPMAPLTLGPPRVVPIAAPATATATPIRLTAFLAELPGTGPVVASEVGHVSGWNLVTDVPPSVLSPEDLVAVLGERVPVAARAPAGERRIVEIVGDAAITFRDVIEQSYRAIGDERDQVRILRYGSDLAFAVHPDAAGVTIDDLSGRIIQVLAWRRHGESGGDDVVALAPKLREFIPSAAIGSWRIPAGFSLVVPLALSVEKRPFSDDPAVVAGDPDAGSVSLGCDGRMVLVVTAQPVPAEALRSALVGVRADGDSPMAQR